MIVAPLVSGTTEVGQTLTASAGTWSGSPTSFAFTWRRCDATGANCTSIDGATAPTYTLTPGDIGTTLSLIVTATGKGGAGTATAPTTAVIAAAPVPQAVAGSAAVQPGVAGAVISADGRATVTWQPGAVPGRLHRLARGRRRRPLARRHRRRARRAAAFRVVAVAGRPRLGGCAAARWSASPRTAGSGRRSRRSPARRSRTASTRAPTWMRQGRCTCSRAPPAVLRCSHRARGATRAGSRRSSRSSPGSPRPRSSGRAAASSCSWRACPSAPAGPVRQRLRPEGPPPGAPARRLEARAPAARRRGEDRARPRPRAGRLPREICHSTGESFRPGRWRRSA